MIYDKIDPALIQYEVSNVTGGPPFICTALSVACAKGNISVVNYLLDNTEADLFFQDYNDINVLILAVVGSSILTLPNDFR